MIADRVNIEKGREEDECEKSYAAEFLESGSIIGGSDHCNDAGGM